MTKHDAFGRKIDEDPLAALRGDAESSMPHEQLLQSQPQPQTRAESEPQTREAQPFAATARTIDLRPRTPFAGRLVAWAIGVTILVAVGGVGLAVFSEVDETVDATRDAIESADPGRGGAPQSGGNEDPGGPALGLQRGSLLTRAALAPALARLRDGGHGRLRLLRAAPDRLTAQTVTSAGALRTVNVAPDGRPDIVSESPGVGRGMPTIPYADVDAAAPYRLTRSAAGRLRLPTTRVDYLVLLATPGAPPRWLVYFKDGRGSFEGDGRGRIVRRIN